MATAALANGHASNSRRVQATPSVQQALPFTPFSSIVPFDPSIIPAPTCSDVSFSQAATIEHDAAYNARKILAKLTEGADRAETASEQCQKTLRDVKKLLQSTATTHFTFRKSLHQLSDSTSGKSAEWPQLSPFADAVLQSQPLPVSLKRSHVNIKSNHGSVSVKVSNKLTPAQQAQFHDIKDEAPEKSEPAPVARSAKVDEKAKGNAAVHELTTLLRDVLDAAQLEATDHPVDPFAPSHFAEIDGEDGPTLTLAASTQTKVDTALRRVVNANRINDIATDDLKQLQRLCEPSIRRLTDLQVGSVATDDAIEEWQHRLIDIDASLVAVRISIRTMEGTTRELRPESIVRLVLDLLKHVAEALIPIAEARPKSVEDQSTFSIAMASQKQLIVVLQDFGKNMRMLNSWLNDLELDETAVSAIMYICRALLFAENASSDKESAIGVGNFELLRRLAMAIVVKLFQRHSDQRLYIINELINSIEKLPPGKQAARQYRLPETKPIQLVSALFMQLIQTAATVKSSITRGLHDVDPTEDENADVFAANEKTSRRLRAVIAQADAATKTYTNHIVTNLVTRASNISKSSEEPFRKLLEIFLEDFLNVLGLSAWPAAELLLFYLFRHLVTILKDPKSSVHVRNFALDLLGKLGSGMFELRASTQKYSHRESEHDPLPKAIEVAMRGGEDATAALTMGDSVYRDLIIAIHDQDETSCAPFHKLRWAQLTLALQEKDDESATFAPQELSSSLDVLNSLFMDDLWFARNPPQQLLTPEVTSLAARAIVLNGDLAKSVISSTVSLLWHSMRSEHTTERSQALRSTSILVDTDQGILVQYPALLKSISGCMEDGSPLVRDAAMSLVTKCMEQRPGLGAAVYESVSSRCTDTSPNVRKRAMKVLKEVFIRESSLLIRAHIVHAIVGRVQDHEESVADQASQILSELLLSPDQQRSSTGDEPLAQLLVQVVDEISPEDSLEPALIKFFQSASKPQQQVLRAVVNTLIDGVTAPADFNKDADVTQALLLQTTAVLVQANPRLLDAKHLETIMPYLKNLVTDDDLSLFCATLAVLRYGISRARGLPKDFLSSLQGVLISCLSKLGETEVSAVAICLAAIDSELGPGNREKLVKVQLAPLRALKALQATVPVPEGSIRKTQRLLHMAGQLGQACDFEAFLDTYRTTLNAPRAAKVTALCTELFLHFTTEKQPPDVRKSALAAICAVAQRSPKLFLTVAPRINQVIASNETPLIMVCLQGMLSFFQGQEKHAEGDDEDATGRDRLASTYVATDQDGAAAGLSERFLQSIKHLAFGSTDNLALTATKLMASIVQQGLPHPKECGPTFIALETSPNAAIAQIAAREHRMLHDKHETIIEKEYIRSMDEALRYQLKTVGDASGCTGQPLSPKLRRFWAVLKEGKAKVRQKYIINISQRLSFNFAAANRGHLDFVRFMVENLACFEYDRMEDLRSLVEQMGTVFAAVGATVAQSIDTHVNNISIDSLGAGNVTVQPISSVQLQALSTSSQTLLLIAEGRAQLVRIWGSKILRRDKGTTAKPASKSANAVALTETFLTTMRELAQPPTDEAGQIAICQRFMEVMNVDSEARIGSDDDADGSDDEAEPRKKFGVPGTPSGRKRKSVDRQTGPKKRAREPARRSMSAVSKQTDEQDDDGDWP